MKRFDAFTMKEQTHSTTSYLTIVKTDSDGIGNIEQKLPQSFLNAKKRMLTILNFEAFYTNDANPQVLLRSDCTEMISRDIGFRANEYNDIICLSGRGFCGYLYYDMTQSTKNELTFELCNPNPDDDTLPTYVCIQLMLEYE